MALDTEGLLKSHGDAEPSGPNLESDPAFIELELAAQFTPERQIGKTIVPAEEPDYTKVRALATKVLERSHDLRAAMHYAHAALRQDGITGFAPAVRYLRRCLEDYWDTCHPELDAEDDNDPTERVNCIRGLADPELMLRAVRIAPLAESMRIGRFGLREVLIVRNELKAGPDEHIDQNQVSAAFQDTPADKLKARLEAVRSCRADLKAIDAVFDDKTPGQGPDLQGLHKYFYTMEQVLKEYAEEEPQDDVEAPEAPAEDSAGNGAAEVEAAAAAPRAAPAGAARGVGQISSRQDVMTAIDRICDYYTRHEPSSPLPMLLRRAQRLVMSDFETILQDLAPQGLDHFRVIAGSAASGNGASAPPEKEQPKGGGRK